MAKPLVIRGIHNDPSHQRLIADTTVVHISYRPFDWLIVLILQQAPRVKIIRVTPTEERRFSQKSRSLLEKKGITLQIGRLKEHERKPRGPLFLERKNFLETLPEPALDRLNQLLAIDHRATKALLHFYGARGFKEKLQIEMLAEFRYPRANHLSDDMNGVLHFLDKRIAVSKRAENIARVLPKKIIRELAQQKN